MNIALSSGDQFSKVLKPVLNLLAEGKYGELERLTKKCRLSEGEIARAIADYGRKLTLPPDGSYSLMDVVEVKNSNPKRWSVAMPLFTKEEGRSDLTLEVTIIDQGDSYRIELDNLHVL